MIAPVLIAAVVAALGAALTLGMARRRQRRRRAAWRRYMRGGGLAWSLFQRRPRTLRIQDQSSPARGGGSPQD